MKSKKYFCHFINKSTWMHGRNDETNNTHMEHLGKTSRWIIWMHLRNVQTNRANVTHPLYARDLHSSLARRSNNFATLTVYRKTTGKILYFYFSLCKPRNRKKSRKVPNPVETSCTIQSKSPAERAVVLSSFLQIRNYGIEIEEESIYCPAEHQIPHRCR